MDDEEAAADMTGDPVAGDGNADEAPPQDITCRGGLALPPLGVSVG